MSRIDKPIDPREVLFRVNMGIDIIERYTRLKKKGGKLWGLCPYHRERSGSFKVDPETGKYRCYGCGEFGDAIDLIMKKMGMEYDQALNYIIKDFNLDITTKIEVPVPVKRPFTKLEIDFVDKPFTRQHHKYFNAYHLTEDFLRGRVFAIDKWAINGKLQAMDIHQYSFAYWDEENDFTKVLSLNVPKENKWRTNADPLNFIWNLPKEPVEDLIYAKSNKDREVFNMLGYNACAATSENAEVSIQIMPKVLEVCERPLIHFGSNEVDAAKTELIVKEYPMRSITTPKSLLKFEIEDISDHIKEFDIRATDKLIKKQL